METGHPEMKKRRCAFRLLRALLGVAMALPLLAACHYSGGTPAGTEITDSVGMLDSAAFVARHHYWRGHLFRTDDSLRVYAVDSPVMLQPQSDDADALRTAPVVLPDTFVLPTGTTLTAASFTIAADSTADSVWVYVTAPGGAAGWTKEAELLASAAPNDPISHWIHLFSRWHGPINIAGALLAIGVIALFAYRRRSWQLVLRLQGSPYPLLLRAAVSLCGVLYAAVWHFAPHTWTEFYFNPTLNPLAPGLPLVLAVFLASTWLLVVASIAVLDDVWRRLPPKESACFLVELAARCVLVNVGFSLTTEFIYLGYVLLLAYWGVLAYAWWRAWHRPRYQCGNCGALLATLPAKCPRCHMFNTLPDTSQ